MDHLGAKLSSGGQEKTINYVVYEDASQTGKQHRSVNNKAQTFGT